VTVLGHHSIGELKDWLSAVDYETGQIAVAYTSFASAWQAQDAATHKDWATDWKSFQARYGAARAKARSVIARSRLEVGIPESLLPVEDEWQGVLHALAANPGTVAKGDFQDLYNRLTAAQGKPVDMSKMPQPTAPDADLNAYGAVDSIIREGEAVVGQVTPSRGTGTLVVVGLGLVLGILLATRSVLR
jgi:hypothetical protein